VTYTFPVEILMRVMPRLLVAILPAALLAASSCFVFPAPPPPGTDEGAPAEAVAATLSRAARAVPGHQEATTPWHATALGFALGVVVALAWCSPAVLADEPDLDNGRSIFLGTCAACHAGGNNSVQVEKTLKKDVLQANGMYDVNKIMNQVTNGKNSMPAFGERLGPDDILDAASYVLSQADKGW